MKNYFPILLFCLMIISCGQNASEADKKAIKELQEKVSVLEKELQELKTKTGSVDDGNNTKQISRSAKDYFTIGSSEDEVIQVMGDPTNYYDFGTGDKRLQYGLSSIMLSNGKVKSYNNLDGNLKVRVKK